MTLFQMRLPDVGEGVAEAELVEWLVEIGQDVTTDSALAEVLTDKATVEISSPVNGVVTALHGEPGDRLAVGSYLIDIETAGPEPTREDGPASEQPLARAVEEPIDEREEGAAQPEPAGRATAAPAVRARARSLGIDLATVRGSGPGGRVVHDDLDRAITGGRVRSRPGVSPAAADGEGRPERVRGVRRRIAERLTATWQEIPHITYVEGIDVTELARLRAELNRQQAGHGARLTILPFLARAIAIACAQQPRLNAHYDHAAETLTTFDAVHVGIATQTDDGLLVPVVRHVEARSLWDLAGEIARLTESARNGSATRADLSGSTITITSLGALGGLATTPILNAPEVAIVGVNKMETRPVWRDATFEPRQVLNLSCSFDHRIVDGWDAATFVQRIKALLEAPALLFLHDE